jgi:hypothetical protein
MANTNLLYPSDRFPALTAMKLLSVNVQQCPAIPEAVGPVPETLEQRRDRITHLGRPRLL